MSRFHAISNCHHSKWLVNSLVNCILMHNRHYPSCSTIWLSNTQHLHPRSLLYNSMQKKLSAILTIGTSPPAILPLVGELLPPSLLGHPSTTIMRILIPSVGIAKWGLSSNKNFTIHCVKLLKPLVDGAVSVDFLNSLRSWFVHQIVKHRWQVYFDVKQPPGPLAISRQLTTCSKSHFVCP